MGVKVWERLPEVAGVRADGQPFTLGERPPGPLVLFFFPKAFAPMCTQEACGFRDAQPALSAHGARLIGVSRDPPEALARFAAQYELAYPLVSDESGALARAFGVELFGGHIARTQRRTFVVDAAGVVCAVIEGMFDPKLHVREALATIAELHTAAKE